MAHPSARQAFTAALDILVEQVQQDRSILAAILCGSLSHDTVWAKSDIDLVLVTIDDGKVASGGISLYAEGINVHASLIPRAEFRQMVEATVQNSFDVNPPTHQFTHSPTGSVAPCLLLRVTNRELHTVGILRNLPNCSKVLQYRHLRTIKRTKREQAADALRLRL